MRALFIVLVLAGTTVQLACAQNSPQQDQDDVLQKFQGRSSQTTPAFSADDRWEVRWSAGWNLNISVIASDGTVVAGASTFRGALYIPKGGIYHLQIDSNAPQARSNIPPHSNNGGPRGLQNPMEGSPDGNSSNPNPDNVQNQQAVRNAQLEAPIANEHWTVEVVSMSSAAARNSSAMFSGMPNFNLPISTAEGADSSSPAVPNLEPAAQQSPVGKMTEDQARAVVLIKGDNSEGTGFMIKTTDGPVVVTNIHVISNNPNLKITTNTGTPLTLLSLRGADDRDLAMIAVKDGSYSYLTLARDISSTVQPGDEVITPGNSEGGGVMLNTDGKVLGMGPERIEFDNPVYHGNSGGPVFHVKSGKVIGIVTEAIKVDVSDELDKSSFANRNSAIGHSMRYFGLRLDTVPNWEPYDWRRFQTETAFLDQFQQRNRSLDCYLNAPDDNKPEDIVWQQDEKIVKANRDFFDEAAGGDASQRMDATRVLYAEFGDVASIDMDAIQNLNNFYSFDRQRAKDETEYRKQLKAELDQISSNVSRLGSLPRSNNN